LLIAIAVVTALALAGYALLGWYAWTGLQSALRPDVEFDPARLPAAPDYREASAWLVTPTAPGLALMTPDGLSPITAAEAGADVFFIHPTTFFGTDNWNAETGSDFANDLLENMVTPAQISVFNGCCRLFAPRYRQATFHAFLEPNENGRSALDVAYADVLRAFDHYLEHDNAGRPFVLASHSQGTLHAIRLLEDRIAGRDLQRQLVAAYLAGFALPRDKLGTSLGALPLCARADSIGCLVAWDTYGDGGGPQHRFDKAEHFYPGADGGRWEPRSGKPVACVNPLSWSIATGSAGAELHAGATYLELPGIGNLSLQPTLAPLVRNDITARCGDDGYLYISTPSSAAFQVGKMPGENYHNQDYGLFYKNIRANAILRVAKYLNRN
jgi:hypothetical protein